MWTMTAQFKSATGYVESVRLVSSQVRNMMIECEQWIAASNSDDKWELVCIIVIPLK